MTIGVPGASGPSLKIAEDEYKKNQEFYDKEFQKNNQRRRETDQVNNAQSQANNVRTTLAGNSTS